MALLLAVFALSATALAQGPTLSVNPPSGPPSAEIVVKGTGFPTFADIQVYFDRYPKFVITAQQGSFTAHIKVPSDSRPGPDHRIRAIYLLNGQQTEVDIPFKVETNWPQFGFSRTGTRDNRVENVLAKNNVGFVGMYFKYATGGHIQIASPAVASGVVYFGSTDTYVYALDAQAGTLLWKFKTGDWVNSPPSVSNKVVYVGSNDKNLYALDARTGAMIWKFATGDVVQTSPIVNNGIVYFGSYDKNFYALNASDGSMVWKYTAGDGITSSPTMSNGRILFGSYDGNVYSLDAATGALVWKFQTGGNIVFTSAAVAGGKVFTASAGGGYIYALDEATGTQIWKTPNSVFGSLAVSTNAVFAGSFDGSVYALSAADGSQLWSFPTGSFIESSPAIAHGVVYIGSFDDNIYALDADTGEKLWSFTTGDGIFGSPTVANGIIYFGSEDDNLYAFGLLKLAPQHK
ncbi:MAG: PQQ-binding-like beta-propeller repeat protein [Acidobacteriales bacterium]|nr:PQQ-binding-like beta-propeller repeat protein [Terriglobales bacterium]